MSRFAIGNLHLLHEPVWKNHNGMVNCKDLLRGNAENGGQKLPHCNAMIRACIEFVEKALKTKGKPGNDQAV